MHAMFHRAVQLLALALLLPALALGGPPARASEGPEHVGALKPGGELFWDGPYIEQAGVAGGGNPPLPCGIATCFDYAIDIAGAGTRLRVAIDHPRVGNGGWALELYNPAGTLVANDPLGPVHRFSIELFAAEPSVGTWRLRVIASNVTKEGSRMRAKLEKAQKPKKRPLLLLPDLRPTAPFQIGFGACEQSEIDQYDATRCLRFSTGPQNIGDAHLDLYVRTEDTGRLTGPMYQRVYYSDGRPPEDVQAGEFVWHQEHLHYHHAALGKFELFKVVDPLAGSLVWAGNGPKHGACTLDYLIAEWYEFDQDDGRDAEDEEVATCELGSVNFGPPTGVHMRLTRGWGDYYGRGVEGNYVEFADNPDGLYVIRTTNNPERTIHETRFGNNVSYAYIEVAGNSVKVRERGYGLSPWDLEKVVSTDIRTETP